MAKVMGTFVGKFAMPTTRASPPRRNDVRMASISTGTLTSFGTLLRSSKNALCQQQCENKTITPEMQLNSIVSKCVTAKVMGTGTFFVGVVA
jgi:hypothetical protein